MLNETFASDCQQFPDIYISQGSVAMRLRCGGIFNNCFITRLHSESDGEIILFDLTRAYVFAIANFLFDNHF